LRFTSVFQHQAKMSAYGKGMLRAPAGLAVDRHDRIASQRRKADSNSSGAIMPNTRPIVS
jgi:hypothetical protein